ncbi:MAG TPA: peptidase domain-containing ABC transporter [Caulobacteraceae bacterium]|nr:peptidase domain-containing ABC transporter [Caulobacteraceae bacterium]
MLDALVSLGRRLGVDTSVEAVRRRFVLEGAEVPARTLEAIAADVGLQVRTLRVGWRDLPRFTPVLPAILRLADGRAAILEALVDDPRAGRIAVLSDPEAGPDAKAMIDQSRLEALWSGEIILVKRKFDARSEHQPFGLGWMIRQVMNEKGMFRDIGVASFVSTLLSVATPFIAIIVLDRVIVNHSVSTLYVICGALVLIIVFDTILGYLRRLFLETVATRIDGRLNLYIVDRLLRLPLEYFERTPTGETMSKLGKIWQIRGFLTGQVLTTMLEAITLVVLVPALLLLQWKLAMMVFALAGAIFVIIYLYMRPLGSLFQRVVLAEVDKNSHLTETVQGMRTIKSMALEGRRRIEWDRKVAVSVSARHAWGSMANQPQTWVTPFERMIYSGSIVVGTALALSQPSSVSPGIIMGFSMLAGRTASPLVQLARLMQDLGEVRAAVAEVGSVINAPPEEDRAGTGLRLPIRGEISFQDVSFRYGAGAPLALEDVTFRIRPGSIFGIMGRSGSGKTTITRLLQGLNPSYEGIIKIDGMDLREVELHHLRTHVGVVAQENFLFRGSIRDNIGIAKPGATMSQIVRAAQLAGAEEFIERMPRGYETHLDEGATNLSGGQRQRLAIARALIIDPPVLILDEATSALDAESEAIINANLRRIAKDRTIICVSHRLSMLVPAEAILVMERGQVYDIGRHEELLQRCDIYQHLWRQQNRHVQFPEPHGPVTLVAPTFVD